MFSANVIWGVDGLLNGTGLGGIEINYGGCFFGTTFYSFIKGYLGDAYTVMENFIWYRSIR